MSSLYNPAMFGGWTVLSTFDADNLEELRPTRIGKGSDGNVYYEHPLYGDEVPLLAYKGGRWYQTDEYELP